MPPGGKLSDEDLATLRAWINEGALWPETVTGGAAAPQWWAFQKPVRPAVPGNAANPIDAFLDSKMAAGGLSPAPEADRLTLIRRATFDLHGLPPTPEQVARVPRRHAPAPGSA